MKLQSLLKNWTEAQSYARKFFFEAIILHIVKGYQATFEQFLDAARNFREPNMDYGSIEVDYDSPAVAKLWNNIAPIISLMRVKMKQFLGVLGVDESMRSPFYKSF